MPRGGVLLALLLALALARAGAVDVVPLASVEMQSPKAGQFSLADLKWVHTAVKGVGPRLTAWIPAGRMDDLRAGEAKRAGTNTLPVESYSGLRNWTLQKSCHVRLLFAADL